jgi:hypothetical protein
MKGIISTLIMLLTVISLNNTPEMDVLTSENQGVEIIPNEETAFYSLILDRYTIYLEEYMADGRINTIVMSENDIEEFQCCDGNYKEYPIGWQLDLETEKNYWIEGITYICDSCDEYRDVVISVGKQ